jgi:hypothetical protein
MIEGYLTELGLFGQYHVVRNLALRIRFVDDQAGRNYQQSQQKSKPKNISASCYKRMH